jgi:hypothetical protein
VFFEKIFFYMINLIIPMVIREERNIFDVF